MYPLLPSAALENQNQVRKERWESKLKNQSLEGVSGQYAERRFIEHVRVISLSVSSPVTSAALSTVPGTWKTLCKYLLSEQTSASPRRPLSTDGREFILPDISLPARGAGPALGRGPAVQEEVEGGSIRVEGPGLLPSLQPTSLPFFSTERGKCLPQSL